MAAADPQQPDAARGVYRVAIIGRNRHSLLTHENDALLADLDMNPAEFVTTPGALGAQSRT